MTYGIRRATICNGLGFGTFPKAPTWTSTPATTWTPSLANSTPAQAKRPQELRDITALGNGGRIGPDPDTAGHQG
ncbi:hypothetical protein ABZ622_41315 [Streptomyces sp. NPDC007164]|uniref:hypothetical protein n=1 Tax=Streptomyces sp. NPDC007164 TaxID=3156918 RepID=UPI00340DBCCD